MSSAQLSCALISLSLLLLAAWSAGNPAPVSLSGSSTEAELQSEERETEEDPEQETNSSDEETRGESGGDNLRIEKVLKQILSKSVDVKTVILAKDSTFNFYPSRLKAHIEINHNSKAAAKGNGITSFEPKAEPDSSTTDYEHPLTANDPDSSLEQQPCNDVNGSGDCSTDDTEIPPGNETTLLHIFELPETTSSVEPSEATYTVSDNGNSFAEDNGTEKVTRSIPGAVKEADSIPGGKDTADSEEELVSGRIKGNKYVYIRSLLPVKDLKDAVPNYLVFDVDFEDNAAEDQSHKIVLSYNDQAMSEQWVIDNETQAIRNRLKNLCIDFNEGNQLIASPCNQTNVRQTWLYDPIRRSLHNPHYSYLAEVMNSEAEVGGNVKVEPYDGHPGQQFVLGTLPLFFVLENEKTGLALSLLEDRDRPGTKLVLGRLANPPRNGQLWYLDSKKVLRSKLNDYVIDPSSGIFLTEPFSYEAVSTTSWSYHNRQIINLNDERMVMEPVSIESAEEQEQVLTSTRWQDDRIEQKFKIVYTSPNEIVAPANIVTSLPTASV